MIMNNYFCSLRDMHSNSNHSYLRWWMRWEEVGVMSLECIFFGKAFLVLPNNRVIAISLFWIFTFSKSTECLWKSWKSWIPEKAHCEFSPQNFTFTLFDADFQSDYLIRSQLHHDWNMAGVQEVEASPLSSLNYAGMAKLQSSLGVSSWWRR